MDNHAIKSWLAATEVQHVQSRAALDRTADGVVDKLTGRDARDESITIICVTQRPDQIDQVVENFERQLVTDKNLVVVDNTALHPDPAISAAVERVAGSRLLHRPSAFTLGHCLNDAMDLASTRFVAKFDDDDLYGEHYLGDALLLHSYADAAVVGKHSIFADWQDNNGSTTVLRFVGEESRSTSHLAGGTLVIDTHRTRNLRFPDVSLAEDQGFLQSCLRSRLGVVCGDRFNYVQVRNEHNTWQVNRNDYLRGGTVIGDGLLIDHIFL